jgi:chemotaxis protein MotD
MQVNISSASPKPSGLPARPGSASPLATDDATLSNNSDGLGRSTPERNVFECCDIVLESALEPDGEVKHEDTGPSVSVPVSWAFQLQLSALKTPVENTDGSTGLTDANEVQVEPDVRDVAIDEGGAASQEPAFPPVAPLTPSASDTVVDGAEAASKDDNVENKKLHNQEQLKIVRGAEELQNKFVPMQTTSAPEQASTRALLSLAASRLAPVARMSGMAGPAVMENERSYAVLPSHDEAVPPEGRDSMRAKRAEPSLNLGSGASRSAWPAETDFPRGIGKVIANAVDAVETENQDQSSATVSADVKVTVVRQETHFGPAPRPSAVEQLGKATADAALSSIPLTDAGIAVSKSPVIKVLELHLQPDDLGTITVRMQLSNGRVTLSLGVEGKDLALQIERDRDDLSKYLQATGLTLDGVDVKVLRAEPTQSPREQRSDANGQSPASGGSILSDEGRHGGQSGLWRKSERQEDALQQGSTGSDAGATTTITSSTGLYL